MSGFQRYKKILDLFSEDRSSWTVIEISKSLKTPSSTIYRIVREMVTAEFLESASGSYFRLGPAFIKLNRIINFSDPLVRAGQPFLKKLANENPITSVNVLARLYGNNVMCVADYKSSTFKKNTSYHRLLHNFMCFHIFVHVSQTVFFQRTQNYSTSYPEGDPCSSRNI